MHFAEFYNRTPTGTLMEACSDRSVYILSGRDGITTRHGDAVAWAKRHGFAAYRLMRGQSLLRASPYSGVMEVAEG